MPFPQPSECIPNHVGCDAMRYAKKEKKRSPITKRRRFDSGRFGIGPFTMNKAISDYKEEKIRFGSIRHGAFTMNKAISDYKEEKIWVGSARGPYDE